MFYYYIIKFKQIHHKIRVSSSKWFLVIRQDILVCTMSGGWIRHVLVMCWGHNGTLQFSSSCVCSCLGVAWLLLVGSQLQFDFVLVPLVSLSFLQFFFHQLSLFCIVMLIFKHFLYYVYICYSRRGKKIIFSKTRYIFDFNVNKGMKSESYI